MSNATLSPTALATTSRNARFWTYTNGSPVKITLRRGQRLAWEQGFPTDEGWHYESNVWEQTEDDEVSLQTHTEGRDCDGKSSNGCDLVCSLDQLSEVCASEEDYRDYYRGQLIKYPAWEKKDGYQRDYTAEAAGY